MFGLKTGRVGQVGRVGGGVRGPIMAADFVNSGASGSPLGSMARAGAGATYYDATSTLQFAAANAQRIDYGPTPSGVTNWLKNSSMVGTAAGTPGTLPTGWFGWAVLNGLSTSVIGTGVVSGLSYIDVRLFGTTTGGTFSNLTLSAQGEVPVSNGTTYTHSLYLALVGGTINNLTAVSIGAALRDDTNTYITEVMSRIDEKASLSATLTRFSVSGNGGAVNGVGADPYIQFGYTGAGAVIDITLRIASPQFEQGGTVHTWVPTTSAPANVGATPLGILIEGARTNSIRNPRAEGAVVGTPGTAPTNWTRSTPNTNIVAVGVSEQGIPAVDIQFTNAGAVTADLVTFETTSGIVAAPSQIWCGSVYLRLVNGSYTNLTDIELAVRFYDNTSTFISQVNPTISNPTSGPLGTQRFTVTTTAAPALTAFALLCLRYNTTGAFNFTLRIGAPQLELMGTPGLYSGASSPILPPAGSPAATARNADVLTYPNGLYNPNALSMAVEYITMVQGGGNPAFWALFDDGGTENNYLGLGLQGNTNQFQPAVKVGGSQFQNSDGAHNAPLNTVVKGAASFNLAGNVIAADFAAVYFTGNTTIGVPTSGNITRFLSRGDAYGSATIGAWGWLRKLRLWNRTLSAAELVTATT